MELITVAAETAREHTSRSSWAGQAKGGILFSRRMRVSYGGVVEDGLESRLLALISFLVTIKFHIKDSVPTSDLKRSVRMTHYAQFYK